MLCVWAHGCDPGRLSDGSRMALYQTLSIDALLLFFFLVHMCFVLLFLSFCHFLFLFLFCFVLFLFCFCFVFVLFCFCIYIYFCFVLFCFCFVLFSFFSCSRWNFVGVPLIFFLSGRPRTGLATMYITGYGWGPID